MSQELTKRIITSIILLAVVLNCLFINAYSWLLLLLTVSIISWFEFFNLCKKIYKNGYSLIFSSLLSFLTLLTFVYAAYLTREKSGIIVMLFILLVCIFSDVGGYIVGKSLGGKKLTKISPNKTISGSIGSFLFSLFPIGIYIFFSNLNDNDLFDFVFDDEVIIGCLLISLACQIGDLIISFFKRLAKVKDTGKILPGHGGILDRIDGLIFAIISLLLINKILFWII